ncbi:MAG TPA: phosphoribosylformylglycinamidine synthase subunit PurL [Jatrophihabitans sp.]|uniref:phosphoribosylformylglycinamidine synthase subunit PurL n=1 Tax=Jatrophihabitans sp. TaxID=1932789 RepID=UPI002F0FBBF6
MTATRRASLDTVQVAEGSAEQVQPYAELGLAKDEYARIKEILGRRPTSSELAMYSVMWSEHCSYKSSKVHLKQFAEKKPVKASGEKDILLVGMGENAGVVDVGGGLAVTFKIESHNHPSYVEPHQGAATGVGGIVRDILTMGARPIAVLDSLRFGAAGAADTARVLPGVVSGIGGYGNCLGLPNIGGELVFDPSYLANPLVNALCVGVLRADEIKLAKAEGPGSLVVLFGARTGGDGIGGASVLASASFDNDDDSEVSIAASASERGAESSRKRSGPSKRPAVQVGDPFAEKVLIECCLEIFAADLVTGIQDLGAAGLSCATTELAAAGDGGMMIDLDLAPLRDETLSPEEILMSESQERMMAVVTPQNLEAFEQVCAKWDVTATVLGTVTEGDRLVMRWHGETIVDVPPRTLAHEGPVYRRPVRRPYDQDALNGEHGNGLPRPKTGEQLRATALKLISSPNLADKSWVTDQYDRYVQGNTVLAQPEDAGMVRLPGPDGQDSDLGVAISVDGNGRYCRLDPYAGAQLALAEAYRNVAVTGARPLAVTNCLNFGSPEDPAVMWQFAEAVRGLADGCQQLGIPVTGGNVSFYNQTGTTAILPTPVVGVLGVIDDVTRRTPMALRQDGAQLYLLGDTRDEFGGSEWAHVAHGFLGGRPPAVDLDRERLLADVLINASRDGLIDAAHDLSDGGLFVAVAEACLRGNVGVRLILPEGADPFVFLFSESAGRAIVAVPRTEQVRFTDMCTARGLPAQRIGVLDVLESAIEVQGQFRLPMPELRVAWASTLPALFG